jgi:hypothetical protein
MNGGTLNFYGRSETLSTETVGVVTLNQGTSVISSVNHSNGVGTDPYSADFTLSGFGRTAGSGATVNFSQNYNGNSAGMLGLIGSSERIIVTGGIPLTNNIIGGFAVDTYYFNTTLAEFASYIPTLGEGALNTPGFAGYDGTILVANQPAQNIRLTAGGQVTAGGSFVNSLNLASNQTGAVSLTFTNAGDILNLTSGGLLVQNVIASSGATNIGTALLPGLITAGGVRRPGFVSLLLRKWLCTDRQFAD